MTVVLAVHNSVACWPILSFGSAETRQQYLPRMASGEWIGGFALTESHCGSDASALRTTAVKDGDHFVINGSKCFITNGHRAGLFVVLARTDNDAPKTKGISAFIVERDTPGLSIGPKEDKLGMRASDTVPLTFANCRVPAANLPKLFDPFS